MAMVISEILLAGDVVVALKAREKTGAVGEVLGKLRGDERVSDWAELSRVVLERDAAAMAEGDCAICIAHGRTGAVKKLVMAVGRSVEGLVAPEVSAPVRLVFVVGIPEAFDSAYLRLVGALVRVCRDPGGRASLLEAGTQAEFVAALEAGVAKLG